MNYKTNFVFLIFAYGFFFGNVNGNIILIDHEGGIIISSPINNNNNSNAHSIYEPNCLNSLKKYVECKNLKMTFVNERRIFAEIGLRYDDDSSTSKQKNTIHINITFGKENIILSYKKKHKFSYDAYGFYGLQTFFNKVNKNIYFKVVKIYDSNIYINEKLENTTVYDEEIKNQLFKVQNFFLWKYAKEDLVSILYPSCPNITLENFINNSTTFRKTVQETLTTALDIMSYRTAKYACLLVVYAYEALYISQTLCWDKVLKFIKILNAAQLYLSRHNKNIYFFLNISDIFRKMGLKTNSYDTLFMLSVMVTNFTKILLTSEEINDEDLIQTRHSKCNTMNTHILPVYALEKLFKGFPKPLEEHVLTYKFEEIPTTLNNINEKLFKICTLIETEYEIFFNSDL
ncbi:uncharacterized protein LOC126906969 [Daktulosphaira vitifoliae]|uniref:uncharacterized protein LOC126906969 n=1 Tax=Daktulosphaira vitifoliae TaxID=58002 RepID=UPI0021AA89B1|nr:uncharacterized protein LOC126906969 [Daktulosphaira vitifoliae]